MGDTSIKMKASKKISSSERNSIRMFFFTNNKFLEWWPCTKQLSRCCLCTWDSSNFDVYAQKNLMDTVHCLDYIHNLCNIFYWAKLNLRITLSPQTIWSRAARWYVFKPKLQIWVNFGGPWNEKSWLFLWPFGSLVAIWYVPPRFGILNKEKSGTPDLKS
jgi:hypothetical protein